MSPTGKQLDDTAQAPDILEYFDRKKITLILAVSHSEVVEEKKSPPFGARIVTWRI